MISKKMKKSLDSAVSIRDIFEEGKRLAGIYGAENVYNFSIGNPSVLPPAIVNESMIDILKNEPPMALHSYPSNAGHQEAREAVAHFLNDKFKVPYGFEDIIITSGAAAALALISNTVLDQGDEVIVFAPYFWEYKNYVECAYGKVVEAACDSRSLQPDEATFRAAFSENTQLVFINTPNNPTGAVYSEASIQMVARVMEEMQEKYGHPIYLVADEPYRQLAYGDITVPYLPDYYKNTMVVYSYSKTLSIPGMRIGYIAMTPGMADLEDMRSGLVASIRYMGFVCAPSLQQKILPKVVDKVVDISIYQKNRDLLYDNLTSMGYECVHPDGAFYLFVRSLDENDEKFCEKAKEERILMAPGSAFSQKGYVRISYCVSEETIKNSLPGFKHLMDCYKK
ncbi:MAG: pyridoxal phosphate-dependent aminotransferase [Lachnospiraceae bacterium]